jgi:hypothetical protein
MDQVDKIWTNTPFGERLVLTPENPHHCQPLSTPLVARWFIVTVAGRQDRGNISGTMEDADDSDVLPCCHKEDHVVAVSAGADVIPELWS